MNGEWRSTERQCGSGMAFSLSLLVMSEEKYSMRDTWITKERERVSQDHLKERRVDVYTISGAVSNRHGDVGLLTRGRDVGERGSKEAY